MSEHFPKNVVSVSTWCNTCRRKTQHRTDHHKIGSCTEHAPSVESEKQRKAREKREIDDLARGVVLMDYQSFIENKSQMGGSYGFSPDFMPHFLFDFQQSLVEWAIVKGRAAIFADCGLGKTPMGLVWGENVVRHENKPVICITPLAVSHQWEREAAKFGIEGKVSRDGTVHPNITITNYERLHYFNPDDFAGAIGDESSAIKAFDGKRRKEVTRFLSKIPYRLLLTATAAPNDFIELGTASEALGELTQDAMLGQFFRSSDKMRHSLFKEGDFWNRAKYFFRPYSEQKFWQWVCSWARALRSPEDLGFDGTRFVLPKLVINQTVVTCEYPFDGMLFRMPAKTLAEQREERKLTLNQRCEKVAELVEHDETSVSWCQYNPEGDLLEKLIPGCVQVAGCQSDEEKEEKLNAFSLGQVKKMVIKPKIGAWGLNWQHCGHHTFFPSHSFEQFYQAIRRSLRFGRIGDVTVDIVTTEGESGVTDNLNGKQEKADRMFSALVSEMHNTLQIKAEDRHLIPLEVPSWL